MNATELSLAGVGLTKVATVELIVTTRAIVFVIPFAFVAVAV